MSVCVCVARPATCTFYPSAPFHSFKLLIILLLFLLLLLLFIFRYFLYSNSFIWFGFFEIQHNLNLRTAVRDPLLLLLLLSNVFRANALNNSSSGKRCGNDDRHLHRCVSLYIVWVTAGRRRRRSSTRPCKPNRTDYNPTEIIFFFMIYSTHIQIYIWRK